MRKNPELEPLSQIVVVHILVLATPATALVPNRNSFAAPLDQSVTWRGGTCYMGNSQSSTYHRPGMHPNLHHTQTKPHYKLERTLPLRLAVLTQHGEQQLPVISRRTIGVKQGARGCSRRWEGSYDLTGQLLPASSWAAPRQKDAVPPRSLMGACGLGTNRKVARN